MKGRRQKVEGKSTRQLTRKMASRLFFLLPLTFCLFTSCGGGVQSALNPAGPQAGRISRLWWLMLSVCTAVFVTVCISIAVAVWRSRQKPGTDAEDAPLKPENRTEQRAARIVAGAVGLTVVILFVFLVSSFRTGRALYSLQDEVALNIRVTGHRWWWDVRYEDAKASNTFRTANEIHIPVGRSVQLSMTSDDVIHSFWAPNLDGKKDLLPGHLTTMWFKADHEGEFYGQCAEFCGHQHAHMRFVVIADAPEKFDAWLDAQRRPSAQATTDAQQRGQQVFLSSPCIMCHTVRGTSAHGSVAPDLTHLASRKTIAAGTLQLTREHLAQWVTNSQEIKPGNRMPQVPLAQEDLQALLSYLESLK